MSNLFRKLSNSENLLPLLAITFLFSTIIVLTGYAGKNQSVEKVLANQDGANDFWADTVIGKRDFGEISARKVVDFKLNIPGGVAFDNTSRYLYVWDSGNNRILGVNSDTCYGSPTACAANLVIGQPGATDYGACNRDASFSNYPNRAPSSSETLCGVPERTHTVLEEKSFAGMFVDNSSNLYVPDFFNNRVLMYTNPVLTDTVADKVWGQSDFSGNLCNQGGSVSAYSLCFDNGAVGAGVTVDISGNLWVADAGNNRVLRYPANGGTILTKADIVLGQPDMSTSTSGSSLSQMNKPSMLRFDNDGNLYVVDSGNNRILKFSNTIVTGMNAAVWGSGFNFATSIEYDQNRDLMWVLDVQGLQGYIRQLGKNGGLIRTLPALGNPGGGSIALDNNNNLLVSTYVQGNDVLKFHEQSANNFVIDDVLFSPPSPKNNYNLTSNDRLEAGGLGGVAVVGSQLIATDGRLLYWDNVDSLISGLPASGQVKGTSFSDIPGYIYLKADKDNRIWVAKLNQIEQYNYPLSEGLSPNATLSTTFNLLGGGTVSVGTISGIVPTKHSEFLWVSDVTNNRVLRVRNPLTNPLVDVILGQTSSSGKLCNQGKTTAPRYEFYRAAANDAPLNELCSPGSLSMDNYDNLYVSDHWLEVEGNWRTLLFLNNQFPSNTDSVVYNTTATKEFPRVTASNSQSHAFYEVAFDSTNRMVVGYNPYLGSFNKIFDPSVGPRFIQFYNNPLRLNNSNPSDPSYALPDGSFKDYYSWATALAYDSQDNLYAYDSNRGQIRIYNHPFVTPPTPVPTVVSTVIPIPVPTATPVPVPTATPAPLPTATSSALKIQYYPDPGARSQYVDTVLPTINIVNDSSAAVPLSQLTIRYYFTQDVSPLQSIYFYCDASKLPSGCRDITGVARSLPSPKTNADSYLQIGFRKGTLKAHSQTSGILVDFTREDEGNFNQYNDYSFVNRGPQFTDWQKITLYRNGKLIWGVEPQ